MDELSRNSSDTSMYLGGRPGRRSLRDYQEIMRLVASIFGLVVMGVGLFLCIRMFVHIYRAVVVEPERIRALVATWSELVVGDRQITAMISGTEYPLGPALGIVVLGGACLALAHIGVAIMLAGVRIVSFATTDREAVSRIIRECIGVRQADSAPLMKQPPGA